MIRLCTVVLAALFAFGASAGVPITSTTIAINPDGTHQSKYPSDSAPAGALAFSGLKGGVENAGSQSIIVGTPFSHEICQYLSGTEKATATLSIVGVTGDNPATEGWTLSASNCATTSNLQHSALQTGSGSALTRVVGASSSDDSAAFNWAAITPDPGDAGFAFPCEPSCSATASSATLTIVPTFHNAGMRWAEASGTSTNEAICRYRVLNVNPWKQCLSLWWDNRPQGTGGGQVPFGFKEYRGSVFKLTQNTTYEIEVMTQTAPRKFASTQVTTWNETFPEGTTVTQPATSTAQLTISDSGTASAYRIYDRAGGWSVDGNNAIDYCVRISGSYVIVRNLTCVDVRKYGVGLDTTAHHVVIEDSDISKFGTQASDGFACWFTGGIGTVSNSNGANLNMVGLVIQNNLIHDPNYDANSWGEAARTDTNCAAASTHPNGAGGIFLQDTGGQGVIRYNRIYSDSTHMFNDGIGGGQNFSINGNLQRDSDVYGNSVSHSWDDAIEVEGANMNVRIYENYIENSFVCIANAGVAIGPLYRSRNVCTKGIRNPGDVGGQGQWLKAYIKPNSATTPAEVTIGLGRIYDLHNTVYKTSSSDSVAGPFNTDGLGVRQMWGRCNIVGTKNDLSSTYVAELKAGSDFSYTVGGAGHTQWLSGWATGGTNNLASDPIYDSAHASGTYTQATNSPAFDACAVLPNINDDYLGAAPDIGAVERGQTAPVYGPR